MITRRPRIYCFGCSFTQGVEESNFTSYVHSLAKLLPEYDFYNYGAGGTSELFHSYLLRTLPDKQPNDISIFQITSMGRLTWWNNVNLHDAIQHRSDNNYELNSTTVCKNVDTINYGTLSNKYKSIHSSFAIKYYSTTTDNYHSENFRANSFYASQYFDYAFAHRSNINIDSHIKYDSYCDNISDEEWNSYLLDSSDHFNIVGCDAEAEWVYKNLKKKNLINRVPNEI